MLLSVMNFNIFIFIFKISLFDLQGNVGKSNIISRLMQGRDIFYAVHIKIKNQPLRPSIHFDTFPKLGAVSKYCRGKRLIKNCLRYGSYN